MAGLFFCLASTRCRAFVLPCCNTATQKRLQRVLCCPCSYTARATKQRTELYRGFTRDYARSTAHDIRPTQADIIPPAQCWSVSQRPDGLHRYQILPPLRTLHSSAQPPYYNKVYKGAPPVMDPCQTVQHIADHASPAGSQYFPRLAACDLAPGQSVTLHPAGQGGRRGTIGGYRRISFRAFAR